MSLSRIQSLRLAAVLEDCLDRLDIMGHTLTVQIGRERGTAAALEYDRLANLRGDCQCTSQEVSKLHLELVEKQSLNSLLEVEEAEEQKKKTEDMIRKAKKEEKQREQVLSRQREELQRKNEELQELNPLDKEFTHRQDKLLLLIDERRKLDEKIHEQQAQESQRKLSQAEKMQEDRRELLQIKLKQERRVHEDSKKFLQNRHEELQQQLQHWQQCTQQMLQEKMQQLNSVCCKRTVNLDRLMEMRRKFREMEQVVKEDREEQEKLRQQQAEARAAIKLQAWWRGCMVRRGLGSFKKAEEGKKGKKKKEGKKKKK